MAISDAKATVRSIGEENSPLYFGDWLKRRRQELNLTQDQLAKRASCSVFAIRKIELGERRPSKQLAGLLAQSLEVQPEDQDLFIKVARGSLSVERLPSPARLPARESLLAAQPVPISANLPRALTPFIGRASELSTLDHLLCDPQCSLVTIVGPGGIGKTRLAIEAANQSKGRFSDGAWFVSLAAVNSPALLVPAVADALQFRYQEPTNPLAQLQRYLCDKHLLLVLDNAEHLLDAVSAFTEVLQNCPQVKLLVTSRERLNLLGEWVFEVQGLPMPSSENAEQFECYSSVALFLQSARRVRAGFALGEEDRRCVLKICQILEGMPLGIELAAAWLGMLPCDEIASEIERNIDFLAVSMRDLPERQRSLRACIEHSWNLLRGEEQQILSRLSVFHGSFRREAAEAICGASLPVLSSFRNKMLLYRNDQDLYHLHDIIRQYAALRLTENSREDRQVKERHATYYSHYLAECEKTLKGPQQLETLNEMAQMINNLRQGWRWMLINGRFNDTKRDLQNTRLFHNASFSLSLFFEMRLRSWEAIDLFSEAVEFLKAARATFEQSEDDSRYNSVLGTLTAYLGLHQLTVYQHAKARENLEEAIHLLEGGQSKLEKAQAQSMLGWIYYQQGRMQQAEELMKQSIANYQEEQSTWWYLATAVHLAQIYLFSGKLSECEALYQEVSRLSTPGDFRVEIPIKRVYAYLCYFQNDIEKSKQLMQENLELAYQYKNHWVVTANRLIDLGMVALNANQMDAAERYIQECIDLVYEHGDSYELALAMLYAGKCSVARSNMAAGREKFCRVIKMGLALNTFYLVYWGMVNIARSYMVEGQTENALEIMLVLKDCSVEYKIAREEGNELLADLQAMLPKEQLDAVRKPVVGTVSLDQAEAAALAYALERMKR